MKNKEKVAELIDSLKSEIESPYELAAIERLEKELIDGAPKVEIIDENHQKFLGINFRKNAKGHYISSSLSIQRVIWIYHFGTIFENYQIHHKDLNKDNNSIENFQALSNIDHQKLHASIDRKKIHKCTNCGKEFKQINHTKNNFCCKKCLMQYRRKNRIDDELKTCIICGNEFKARKDKSTKTCSIKCTAILMSTIQKNNLSELEIRICQMCGTPFPASKHGHAKYCSVACRRKKSHMNEHLKKHQKSENNDS